MKQLEFIFEMLLITFIALIGKIVFKIGTEGFGTLTFKFFLDPNFYKTAFYTKYGWIVFFSLVISFVSKILVMLPLSKMKFGIVWVIFTPLGIILSIASGYLIFHETYSWKEYLGVTFAIMSAILLGGFLGG